MLTENGRIVAIEADALWVETIQRSTCQSCVAEKGCGQSLLTRLGAKPTYLRVLLAGRSPQQYQLNQSVVLGIPDDVVVKGSLLAYGLPLMLLLVFAIFAHNLLPQEWMVIAAAVVGFLLGGVLLHFHSKRYRNDLNRHPVIIDQQTTTPLMFQQNE